jgi:hypothetical protein
VGATVSAAVYADCRDVRVFKQGEVLVRACVAILAIKIARYHFGAWIDCVAFARLDRL